jgi:hypothetical protein
LAAFTAPAAAHDAPLAFVEALETHLLDCPSVNGYGPEGDMLSPGWEKFESDDPLLNQRAAQFMGDRTDDRINVNLFRKEVEGIEMIQFMAAQTTVAEGVDPGSDLLTPDDFIATEYSCTTLVPDLPFMPGGAIMNAIFGKDVDVSVLNMPGDTRTGAWLWEDISPTHIKTVASYTDSESAERLLPDNIFYRGFYISSLRRFTPDTPNEESDQE